MGSHRPSHRFSVDDPDPSGPTTAAAAGNPTLGWLGWACSATGSWQPGLPASHGRSEAMRLRTEQAIQLREAKKAGTPDDRSTIPNFNELFLPRDPVHRLLLYSPFASLHARTYLNGLGLVYQEAKGDATEQS